LKKTSARATAALVFLVPAVLAVAAVRPSPAPLVVISIDGLRPADILDPAADGLKIPNLRRLLSEGAHAAAVDGVLPTVTYPSHATLVTGVSPARHGILANDPFDPGGHHGDDTTWYAEDIRVPTLWDVAADDGLVTSSVDWPVTLGARITYNIPPHWRSDVRDASGDAKLGRALSSPPGLLAEAERRLGPYPSGSAPALDEDRRRAAFNVYLLETRRPRLHLCYFSGLDDAEHAAGPGSTKARDALETIDRLVGEVRSAAESAGNGRAVVAVVSDHGFVSTRRELDLDEALRAAGLLSYDSRGRLASWKALAWSSVGSAAIMLRDPADVSTRRRVERLLRDLAEAPGSPIERVLSGDEARAAGGFPAAGFVVGMKPDARIVDRGEEPLVQDALPEGSHGQLPEPGAMDASFLVAGPGVPRGRDLGRVDMRDIAPTLAALMGVALPSAEGRNLLR
jgi:arylsulfatase A-like enzyme